MSTTSSSEREKGISDERDAYYPPDSTTCRLQQQREHESEYKGDRMKTTKQNVVRIGFLNIRGIPRFNEHHKNTDIREVTKLCQFDHIGFSEVNCQWSRIPNTHKWRQRTKDWWEYSKSVVSFNRKDHNVSPYQPGGTISLTLKEAVHRIYKSGQDDLLGRWTWTTFRGKRGVITTVITGYRPCKNKKGDNSTYTQHTRVMDALQLEGDPRDLWLRDIGMMIKDRIQSGKQVILMADFNENVMNAKMRQLSEALGLEEVLSSRFGRVPTWQQGTAPIDGIYISSTINVQCAEYSEFGLFDSDHRCLWIEVPMANLYGFKISRIAPAITRKLQCDRPAVQQKWIRLYKDKLQQCKVFERIFSLESNINGKLTPAQEEEYESILILRHLCMLHADKKCRKLHTGGIPFSPTIQKDRHTLKVWKGVIRKKKGLRYSSTLLRRTERKAGLSQSMTYTLEEAEEFEKAALNKYKKDVKNAPSLRQTFLESKANKIALHKGEDASKTL